MIKKRKFSPGDYLIFPLTYATVLYEVIKLDEEFYHLQGRKVITHNGKNQFMTEAKSYSPRFSHLESKAVLADEKTIQGYRDSSKIKNLLKLPELLSPTR